MASSLWTCGVGLVVICATGVLSESFSSEAGCSVGDGDGVGLLQVGGGRKAATGARSGREQHFPLEFQLFIGDDTGPVFRVLISSMINDNKYHMLLDTGSSTMALCNGTTNAQGQYVPPDVPMPDGEPTGLAMLALYGGGDSCHGWWGFEYTGDVEVGDISAGSSYAVMEDRSGLRGNQCGLAEPGSVGAERLQGIFGFGGSTLNGPYCSTTYSMADVSSGDCNRPPCLSPSVRYRQAPFMAALDASGSAQFAISWSGTLGSGSGTLSTADAAGALVSPSSSTGVQAALDWQNAYYTLGISGMDASVGGKSLAGSEVAIACSGSCIVDTGSPAISLPPSLIQAVQGHFNKSNETCMVNIHTAGPDGSPVSLQLAVPAWMAAEVVSTGWFFESATDGMLGLSLWIWYETVHFDIEDGQITFIPRSNLHAFLDELGERVAEM